MYSRRVGRGGRTYALHTVDYESLTTRPQEDRAREWGDGISGILAVSLCDSV